jgi:cysteinyl-tRNA synthetase
LIEELVARDHAYPADGDVYFQVRTFPQYGALSHRNVEDMDQGEGVEGAERKRDPLDFALWKAQKPGEDTAWESPWGRGRPGWHIECSAMAESLLGVDFEIHGGGSDLIFPHHENEASQTCAARDAPLARIWMHNGMLRMDREKMAKSVGNIFGLAEAIQVHGRDALIFYFCSGHYHQPIEYDDERLAQAAANVRRIREVARRTQPGPSPAWSGALRDRFFDALADDFNMPHALEPLFEWVREANRSAGPVGDADLREMLWVMGLDNLLAREELEIPDEVRNVAEERERARAARDWERADRLRERIRELGWDVRDGPDGPELLPGSDGPNGPELLPGS